MKHRRLEPVILCLNDISELTILTSFMVYSSFATKAYIWEHVAMMDSLKIIASCDLEFGLYSKMR